jgi:mannosyltransferase
VVAVEPTSSTVVTVPSPALSPPRTRIGRRLLAVIPALVPALLMVWVALWGSGRPELSSDEVATMDVAGRTPAQIWHLVQHIDAVFGPYYFLMHFWTAHFGDTALALRVPSVIALAGTVAVAGLLASRLFSPLTGLVTGLLLVLVPNTSRYAAEARPYAFACFFSVLALLLLHLALERPGPLRWIAYGLAVVLIGCSHIVALTTLVAHAVVVVLHLRRSRSWRPVLWWAGAALVAMALVSPIVWLGMHQQSDQLGWVPPLTVAGVRRLPGDLIGSDEAGWLLVGMAVTAAWRPARNLAGPAVAAVVPVVAVGLASIIGSPMWVTRYMLVVLPFTVLLAAVALVRTDRAWGTVPAAARVTAVLLFLGFAAWPGQVMVRGHHVKTGYDYRGVAAVIQANQRPGDGIVYQFHSRSMRPGVNYYLRRDPGKPRDVLLMGTAAANDTLNVDEYPDLVAHLRGVHRLWLMVAGIHADPTTMRKDLRTFLKKHYHLSGRWALSHTTLALYVSHS